jgi:hypothetical protein
MELKYPLKSRRGERNPFVKLTEPQFIEIFKDRRRPQVAIAGDHNVHPATISAIHNGRNWGWLTSTLAPKVSPRGAISQSPSWPASWRSSLNR